MDAPDSVASARFGALQSDILAGVTVAFLVIPQSMAYAELAGLPAHVGLVAAGLPAITAAFFASSPYLQTGPVALTSLLVLGALTGLAEPESEEFIALAALLAGVVGILRLGLGLLRGGRIVRLFSEPVLRGFVLGAAVLICLSQIPSALGVSTTSASLIGSAAEAAASPRSWEGASVLITVSTAALILGGRHLRLRFPTGLVAMVGALAFSAWTGYSGPTVGAFSVSFTLPTGLGPAVQRLPELLLPGLVIAVVGFVDAAALGREYSRHDGSSWDPNKELVSQGVANLTAAALGSFAVGCSFSRTSLNHLSGARTHWSGFFTGLVVLLALPASSLLALLPRAVLGATVICAVVPLLRVNPLLELRRTDPAGLAVAVATLGLTLLLAPRIDLAIVLGVGLSAVLAAWRRFGPGRT